MNLNETPRANRLHIAFFGRRNAGKSSLINALAGQEVALVSKEPGTTTDPVYKSMELLPLGPVALVDTAGLDDEGMLGELRVRKTKEVMDKTDLAVLVVSDRGDYSLEKEWIGELQDRKVKIIGVHNDKSNGLDIPELEKELPLRFIRVNAEKREGIDSLKEFIINEAPTDFEMPTIVGDLVKPGDLVMLVAPQDIQAPKGRLILPEMQVTRDLLDNGAFVYSVQDGALPEALAKLRKMPDLVITDSQVFKKVNEILPEDVRLTSFSVLMARYKGDIDQLIAGARFIENLRPGDKVLISEACTHHPLKNDIAREKIPKWLQSYVGGQLDIHISTGQDFPADLDSYRLVIHCGGCMLNRKQMLSRIMRAKAKGVPITNYGVAIAYLNKMLDRVTIK